jgi:hypothetical protein
VGTVLTFRVQHLSAVKIVFALPGRHVAVIGGGVTLVRGGPNFSGGIYPLGMGSLTGLDNDLACLDNDLACLDGGLAAFEVGIAWFGVGFACLS